MAFSFDGPNKLVILSAGTVSIDLAEMYSRYKDWLLLGNAGHALAFSTVGGEPIDPSAGTLVPLYLFLLNGWKIRPQEANHTLAVSGGTLLVDGGGDPFVDTLGNYRVRIRYSQPVQAMGYSTSGVSGPSAAEIATAVGARVIEAGYSEDEILRLLAAVAAGNATGLESAAPAFKSLDGSKTRVGGSYVGGARTVSVRDGA